MANVINLTDFGLKTSNTAAQNDTAIASAITTINNRNGGVIVLPVGTFLISSPVVIPVNTSFIGHGSFWSLLKADTGAELTGGMIQINGEYGASRYGHRIENIGLYGNDLAATGIKLFYAVYTNVFKNLYIKNFALHGIYAPCDTVVGRLDQGSWGNTIENCFIYKCGRGIELGTSGNETHILTSTIAESTKAGLYASTCTALDIRGSLFEKNGSNADEPYGVVLNGCMASSFSGCYFEGNGVENVGGSHIYTDESYWNGVERTTCDGSILSGCYFQGIDTYTTNAFNVGAGEITIFGGYSNRHFGKTIVLREGGTVNRYGFVSADSEGIL